jgi:hypothetical protein
VPKLPAVISEASTSMSAGVRQGVLRAAART